MDKLFTLHAPQQLIMDGLKQSIREGHRRPLVQAPTGAGKTVLAAHIVTGAKAKGNRVIFTVPAISLIDQTFERFRQNGVDPEEMGIIQADHPWKRDTAPIQIASVQTLSRRQMDLAGDILVVDEAHIRSEWLWKKILDDDAPRLTIGLSATPWTAGLGAVYDDLINPVSTQDLIDQGFLAPFRVFAPSHPDLSKVKTVAGDYHEGQLAEVMMQDVLVADVVATWLAKAHGLPTLCFAVDRAHAQKLHDQFEASGVAVAYIDANTSREAREEIGRRLAAGEIHVVCNIGCLTTGVDWDVRCIILARPTKSEILFTQIVGRGLRTAEGKNHCLILDHSDTHLRLGMVTEIACDGLSTGKANRSGSGAQDRKLPTPRECSACSCLVPAAVRECPSCGAVVRPHSDVETVNGELVEFAGKGKKPKHAAGSVQAEIALLGKQRVYSELLGYCEEYGKKSGRAAHLYREIFGVWPRGISDWPIKTSPIVRSWIRSRNIAWAKSRGNYSQSRPSL